MQQSYPSQYLMKKNTPIQLVMSEVPGDFRHYDIDLHGIPFIQALEDVEEVISRARRAKKPTVVVVTGKGKLIMQQRVKELCYEMGLQWSPVQGNEGRIRVHTYTDPMYFQLTQEILAAKSRGDPKYRDLTLENLQSYVGKEACERYTPRSRSRSPPRSRSPMSSNRAQRSYRERSPQGRFESYRSQSYSTGFSIRERALPLYDYSRLYNYSPMSPPFSPNLLHGSANQNGSHNSPGRGRCPSYYSHPDTPMVDSPIDLPYDDPPVKSRLDSETSGTRPAGRTINRSSPSSSNSFPNPRSKKEVQTEQKKLTENTILGGNSMSTEAVKDPSVPKKLGILASIWSGLRRLSGST